MFEGLVAEADRDFGLTRLYGPTTDAATIVAAARSIPMLVDKQVVIVKEAQAMRADEVGKLSGYVAAPSPHTVPWWRSGALRPKDAICLRRLAKGCGSV